MAKPQTYKGDDAVKIKCLREYTVKAGSGANAGEDVTYEKGKTYTVSPGTAAHMLRKTYRVYDDPKPGEKRGVYLGDANMFADEDMVKEMAEAEKAAKAQAKADAAADE